MNKINSILHNLATEAKAEEGKIVGRHRKELSPNQKIAHKVHRAAVHVYHTGQLMWIGLPAIIAFELGRPAWMKFVETPIADLMFGNHSSAHTEALSTLSTISTHYFG